LSGETATLIPMRQAYHEVSLFEPATRDQPHECNLELHPSRLRPLRYFPQEALRAEAQYVEEEGR
jgi:hypothetical protein